MKKKITPLFILLLTLATPGTGTAQQAAPQTLAMMEESPAGSQVLSFLETINSEAPVDEALVRKHFAGKLIDKHGAGNLMNMLKDIRQNDAPVTLYDAYRNSKFEYKLKLKSGGGSWLDLVINLEEAPPFKLAGLSIDANFNPAKSETPIWPAGPHARKAAELTSKEEIARQAQKIAQAYHDMGWFSGAVLIAEKGRPFYQEAFGYADIENEVPNTMNTKFRIGSINKDYTAVLVLQMVEAGQLALDDKLEKFRLGFPAEVAGKVTVRQLLNHTAGFGDIFIPEYLDNIRAYKEINDILPLLMDEPLAYEPGADQRYSNYGYIVLGAILEKASGKSYETLLQENILRPLGAQNTHYQIAEKIDGEARSYRYTASGEKVDHTPQLEYPTPDGGMYSTAAEQMDFFQALFYTGKLISDNSKALMLADFSENPPAWEDIIGQKGAALGFAGGGPGVSAVVEMLLREEFLIIVLANTDVNIAEMVARRISRAALGLPVEEVQPPAGNYLYGILKEKGEKHLRENFDVILEQGGYDSSPMLLNRLGYQLMEEGKTAEAITVFRINTEQYPEEANPWDSLAEAHLKAGDKKAALKFYKKALEIDPEFPSAKRMVEELGE